MLDSLKNKLKYHFSNASLINELQALKNIQNENLWASIYHDSIAGYEELKNLSLNVGRWAGGYAFFYILFRILKDFKPNKILELGLGESSKFISTFIKNYAQQSSHDVIEHNEDWVTFFKTNFELNKQSNIKICELEKRKINSFESNSYANFINTVDNNYDFILIDGPFGSNRFSRYNIIDYIQNKQLNRNFVILFDDTNREGEKETLNILVNTLNKKNLDVFVKEYNGNKSSTIISNKQFLSSL